MDKSWIQQPKLSKPYLEGVDKFLNFAFKKAAHEGKILCPCVKCVNILWGTREDVKDHLICKGFLRGYSHWVFHGESMSKFSCSSETPEHEEDINVRDNTREMLHDAFGMPDLFDDDDVRNDVPRDEPSGPSVTRERPNADAEKFYNLLREADQELYPGCKKFNKLSFIMRLFHLKCLNGWSNKSFTMLLELLKEAFPEGERLPKSFYESQKIIGELGLKYEKIDACPNDCMLYWKDKANDSTCSTCGVSRWKTHGSNLENEATSSQAEESKVPAKVLRYFPLKPRLQRLFMSSKTALHMSWHEIERVKDGKLRHPADSPAWKDFDSRHPDFASDARNVRLGLASDGFNPFRTMNINHSTWPVVLMPYNLPPWMCMKQPYIMLSLLIPGPSAPGNDIDVYLQPLIEELQELWEVGLETYDASNNQNFQMRAALMWTISDFPAYANLSGWSTKGRLACPSCNKDTWFRWLKKGRKHCYMGHRRFLDPNHKFRFDSESFDNKQEFRPAPIPPSGSSVLSQLEGFQMTFGKISNAQSSKKKRKEGEEDPFLNWKKKSIFFMLPYWEHNLLRHNIDVMHVEKNICDSVLETLLNIDGKTKDGLNARLDLKDMDIREDLHPKGGENKTVLPPASFSMSTNDKDIFRSVLRAVKVPDGYSSNISRIVQGKNNQVLGLKSHDCHIIMQQLLPLALRRVLPKEVSSVLIELSEFFRILCSKDNTVEDLEALEDRIVLILCQLEIIFLPTFFDVMVHVAVHLATEAKIAGPVHYRWMYPIERYLGTLKSYVRNRAHPEGSIAEGYLAEECLTFCSRYLDGVESKCNRPIRNCDDGDTEIEQWSSSTFSRSGRPIGKAETVTLEDMELVQAHRFVLFNCESVNSFLEQHKSILKRQNRRARLRERDIERIHNESFHEWFKSHVTKSELENKEEFSEEVKWLARGPNKVARRFKGFIINGFRFHTKGREKKRKTQNSGVVVTAETSSFASARDRNPVAGNVTYYGTLKDIIELNYYDKFKVVMFKCDWVDVTLGRGIKQDEYGFTLVKPARLISTGDRLGDEPFVLASQAQQVFYVRDPIDREWHVVIKTKPRDLFVMGEEVARDNVEGLCQIELSNQESLQDNLEEVVGNQNWVRREVDGITIEDPLILPEAAADHGHSDDHDDEYDSDSMSIS